MYHVDHSDNNFISCKASIPSERNLLLTEENCSEDSGLVLSTDAKPRLKWTSELHERFVEAVNQLGGSEKATPKTVMRLMDISGLTLYHLKSHLQKYRLSKNLNVQAKGGGESRNVMGHIAATDRTSEGGGSIVNNMNVGSHNKAVKINDALQMQIEVQRRLNEQLEVQKHLQIRIEAQEKYLQSVLEKAELTLGKQNFEATKFQLSELASKVSKECPNSLTALKESPDLINCSVNSCLTTCEGNNNIKAFHSDKEEQDAYFKNTCNRRAQLQLKSLKKFSDYGLPHERRQLDLNSHVDADYKEFDLNCFSWN